MARAAEVPLNLEQWLEYLEQCHPSQIELGLDRISGVAAKLPIDFPDTKIITVAGTNGKGSTVGMLASIMEQGGYSTACYTSPHLLRYNERVRLGSRLATDEELCDAFAAVEAVRGEVQLTYFEFGTLAALLLCSVQNPDVMILEVGLGGRLDAVNILEPDIAILTNVAIDHTDWLGDTREEIGYEKAGIFRSGKPAVVGEADIPATVLSHIAKIGAVLYANGTAFNAVLMDGGWQWTGKNAAGESVTFDHLPVNDFPLANCATVIQAAVMLAPEISGKQIADGLTGTSLPGRFQQVDRDGYTLVLDVAHNPHAASRLVEQVRLHFPGCPVHVLLAMLSDKNHREVLDILRRLQPLWHVAGIQEERGLEGKILYNYLLEMGESGISCHETVREAFTAVEQSPEFLDPGPDDKPLLLVTGSFFTVSAVLESI